MAYDESRHFQQYFKYSVVKNQLYWWRKPESPRNPLTCRKLLTSFIVSSTPRQLVVVIGIYCTARCKSNYPTITALQNVIVTIKT